MAVEAGLLRGLTVLVTRPVSDAEPLCRLIEAAGGRAVAFPVLAILPLLDLSAAYALIDRLTTFDTAIFISKNAVDYGLRAMHTRGQNLDALTVMAVGQGTAARLRAAGIADLIAPKLASSEGLLALECLQAEQVHGRRILIFRGVGGRETLAETLRTRGASVEYVELYRRSQPAVDPAPVRAMLDNKAVGIVIITSSEGLESLLEQIGAESRMALLSLPLLVFSARTANYAKQQGWEGPAIISADPGDTGIMDALAQFAANSKASE